VRRDEVAVYDCRCWNDRRSDDGEDMRRQLREWFGTSWPHTSATRIRSSRRKTGSTHRRLHHCCERARCEPRVQSRCRKLRPRRSTAAPDFRALHSFTDGLSRIHKTLLLTFVSYHARSLRIALTRAAHLRNTQVDACGIENSRKLTVLR
jgi:hypothetical protein